MVLDEEGKKAFILADRSLKSVEVDDGKVKPVKLEATMELDAAAERDYLFEHAWRQTLKKFYVEDMHGVDWDLLPRGLREVPALDRQQPGLRRAGLRAPGRAQRLPPRLLLPTTRPRRRRHRDPRLLPRPRLRRRRHQDRRDHRRRPARECRHQDQGRHGDRGDRRTRDRGRRKLVPAAQPQGRRPHPALARPTPRPARNGRRPSSRSRRAPRTSCSTSVGCGAAGPRWIACRAAASATPTSAG